MSLFAAWTEKDCYKAQPYMVSEDTWIMCKTSRAKLGLIFTIAIVIIITLIAAFFAPGFYKLIAPAIGLLLIGGSVYNLITVRATAEAEHEVAMAPLNSLIERAKKDGRDMNIEEARMKYASEKAEIDKHYMQERAAQASASGLTSAAGLIAGALIGQKAIGKK